MLLLHKVNQYKNFNKVRKRFSLLHQMMNLFLIFLQFSYLRRIFHFHNFGSQQLWMKNDITLVNIKSEDRYSHIKTKNDILWKQSCLIDQLATFLRLFNKSKKEDDKVKERVFSWSENVSL